MDFPWWQHDKNSLITKKSLTIYINNIPNLKDIEIKGYGFDDSMANQTEKKYNVQKQNLFRPTIDMVYQNLSR